jgi:cell wall assembly regulator SMI1
LIIPLIIKRFFVKKIKPYLYTKLNPQPKMDIQLFFDALKKVMPNVMERLNPPATDEQIAALKSQFDFEIDPLYIDFLKVCNGEKDLLMMGLGMWMTDLGRNSFYHSEGWMDWRSLADNPHLCKDQHYSKKRVQIMEDGGGSYWFLDYDPAPEGKMGQVICVFRDQAEVVYNCFESFEELLQTAIATIESGVVKVSDMQSFEYGYTGNGINYYANKSATYHKNNPTIPDDFFTSLSPEWLWAVSEAKQNPIINRNGEWAKPQEAWAVKQIQVKTPEMLASFCEVMQYLPNVMFLRFDKGLHLEDKHYEVIKKLRFHELQSECPVKNIATLTDFPKSLRILRLARMYDADISEIAVYENLIILDIQRINDEPSLLFLAQMQYIEELQLWHEELTEVKPSHVEVIEKMPKLNNLSCFKTKATNFDNLILRPSPFFSYFSEEVGFVR